MSVLFSLPITRALDNSGVALPGAKLWFFETGTSTPKSAYLDAALTTPAAHPVVADSTGRFSALWMDTSAGAYTVKLTNSANVQVWSVDGVDDVGLTQAQVEALLFPTNVIRVTNGVAEPAADVDEVQLYVDTADDALKVIFGDGTVALLAPSGASSGSFTATLTGCATAPTGTATYSIRGDVVTMDIPAISATSNTTAATLTGVPAALRPATAKNVVGLATDDGTTNFCIMSIETDGSVTLHLGVDQPFTASGTKGSGACTVTYRIST